MNAEDNRRSARSCERLRARIVFGTILGLAFVVGILVALRCS